MKKLFYSLAVLVLVAATVAIFLKKPDVLVFGYDPAKLPEILTDRNFQDITEGEMIWGFVGKDFSRKDFSRVSLSVMAEQTFDRLTVWPATDKLPAGFLPDKWLEACRDQGLNLRKLHAAGFTGSGVTVAVIDKPINPSHMEFAGRIHYRYVEADPPRKPQNELHFHGIMCASVLCGSNLGVAPGAELYYFAVPDNGRNFYNYCYALEELLSVNKGLPEGQKIRAVSISDGGIPEDEELRQRWGKLVERSEGEGIAVVYSSDKMHDLFTWGGCLPYEDKNDPDNYDYTFYFTDSQLRQKYCSGKIILPGDFGTRAWNYNNSYYFYEGQGGFSSAIPYFVGLATLAWGVDKDLKIDDIFDLIKGTSVTNSHGRLVVNPTGFIEAVKQRKSNT